MSSFLFIDNITNMELLNIEYLKKNHKRIYYFGLGFIQVILNDSERIHFYTDELPTTNEDIHTHRYNFISTILKGEFRNIKYRLIDGKTHILKNESCSLEREITNNINIEVGIEVTDISDYKEGDSYNMFYNELHSVSYKDNTITFLKRSDIITDYAQVVFRKNVEEVCPFSTKIDEDRLWDIIKRIIEV